ncbi:hypothetical protein EKO27_g6323 [Xylaria grammica]|uniref:Uncharacterized protein n=1 Tax=Xylaria grammica TaxID=363999 RepID=A0A439D2Y5_9PEZI|nr:hypothetical protein EKO27_g6323 [Xylaria grammica]
MSLGNCTDVRRQSRRAHTRGPPRPPEHGSVLILKLIDFGDAKEVTQQPEDLPRNTSFDEQLNLAAEMREDLKRLEVIGKSPNDGRQNFRGVATDINILEIGVAMGRLVTNDLTNPQAGVLRETMVELRDNIYVSDTRL